MMNRTRIGTTALVGLMTASALGLGGCVIVIGGKGRGDWEDGYYSQYQSDSRRRPFIGVTTSGLSESLATQLDVGRRRATLITSVEDQRPAARAGLAKWDVVVAIDGDDNASPERLRRAILDTEPGDSVVFTVLRQGETEEIEVEPEPRNTRRKGPYED